MALIGLVIALPLAAFVLLYYLRISGEHRFLLLVLLTFVALWITLFGLLRPSRPRLLAMLCILPALFQYGGRATAYLLSEHYASVVSMLWINVSQLPDPMPPSTALRQTHSGLKIYETDYPVFETPLPNTRYFNPFLELRTSRLRDGFRNSANVNSVRYGEESYLSLVGYELPSVGGDYLDSYRMAKKVSTRK